MADLFQEVQRIYKSLSARHELNQRVRQGDIAAAETFFYFALWREIKEDRTYPPRDKPRLCRALFKHLQENAELHFTMTKEPSVG
jgi:hypothetical protein